MSCGRKLPPQHGCSKRTEEKSPAASPSSHTRNNQRGKQGKHHPAEMTVLLSPSSSLFLTKPSAVAKGRAAAAAVTCFSGPSLSVGREEEGVAVVVGRRALASAAAVASVLGFAGRGLAANQGLLAGRVPGLSEPDENDRLENVPQARRQVRWPRSWLEPHHPVQLQSSRRLG